MPGSKEIYVDDEAKLTLHGLQQYYVEVSESEKNRKLNDLLDALEFNQVVVFVGGAESEGNVRRGKARAETLSRLKECLSSIYIHGKMKQAERIAAINV